MIQISAPIHPKQVPLRRRYNFRKADWDGFARDLDDSLADIIPNPEIYERFIDLAKRACVKDIPRGCRTYYIPGFTDDSEARYGLFCDLYDINPFPPETLAAGEEIVESLAEEKSKRWIEKIESLDMTHSSHKAWCLLRQLSGDPTTTTTESDVTLNQISTQLSLNGKPNLRTRKPREVLKRSLEEEEASVSSSFSVPFSIEDLENALKHLKAGKAAGIDDIRNEILLHLVEGSKS